MNKLIPEAVVEVAARAVEKATTATSYGWSDEQFETWWTSDPEFVQIPRAWSDFRGTRKERRLWETRIALTAAQQQQAVACPYCGGTGGHWEGCRAPVGGRPRKTVTIHKSKATGKIVGKHYAKTHPDAVKTLQVPAPLAPSERSALAQQPDWYARREQHAREMGYTGLADALADLERRRSEGVQPAAVDKAWPHLCENGDLEMPIEGFGVVRVPAGYDWIAQDKDGGWWAYNGKPDHDDVGCWDVPGLNVYQLTGVDTPNPNWRDTLTCVRPESQQGGPRE